MSEKGFFFRLVRLSFTLIFFQTSKSQQKHRVIKNAADAAPVYFVCCQTEKEKGTQILWKKMFILSYWEDKGVIWLRCSYIKVFHSEVRGMLVLQISHPCVPAKTKQIPNQGLHCSSLSCLLSQRRIWTHDIWGRVWVRIKFSIIGIHSVLCLSDARTRQQQHINVARSSIVRIFWACALSG